ncbi:phospho-sugar mutase [Bacteriovorax sp. Seq25_V]|uniref:phospho-sugar mutase n=1 Tax=Bacteriovorax sp. Seq25_V TaxID=1201288 RepID=UPI00038A4050|nr:phospho-sugar mutase [Bacteriovorax sp. Seq25_V]EQC45484.1 phosphoglucomutase/phosphomannomutase, alpha/beta/alpha domain I [Bacteriovorax sp. Seq25_V]
MNSLDKAQAWANNEYFSPESRAEIQALIDANDTKEIEERFYRELEFGTGGIRSILGAGNNRINIYTVRKATQALASEVLDYSAKNNIETPKVAISYDSRRFSFEFAKETAAVMAANGIHAYIYERLNPVALLSFSVRHHGAQAGVMVTASHNPPEYNGYKVYWNDGAQVTPPNDKNIINRYANIERFEDVKVMSFEDGLEKGLIHWVGTDVEDKYFEAILSKAVNPTFSRNNGKDLKIIYTPIHGTGLVPCLRGLSDLGFTNVEVVKEQAQPDGSFPTVSSPNPENPEALKMAVDLMEKTGGDIVMGSDPDTDRLGVAIKHNGEVVYLNGNQIGILMLHYILESLKEQDKLPENSYFVKTVVTTPLQEVIAAHYGVESHSTLTGFKWICGLMNKMEIEQPNKNFLFATEESFGYLPHNFVRDKDGIASVTLMSEVALYYKRKGIDLVQALDKIYEQFGFSEETLLNLNYFGKEGSEKITRIMAHFRSLRPTNLCGHEISVIEDYEQKIIEDLETNEKRSLDFPKSNVIGYHFKNGSRLYLRPSGTEPKIKFYIMLSEKEGSLNQKKEKAMLATEQFLNFIKETANNC